MEQPLEFQIPRILVLLRLNQYRLDLPPLRERRADIEPLIKYFVKQKTSPNVGELAIASVVIRMLADERYYWRGNIRELENIIERAVMLTQGNVILADELCEITDDAITKQVPLPVISPDFTVSRDHILHIFEKQFIIDKLTQYQGNVSAAAKASSMSRQNFHRLMNKHKMK